MQRLKILTWHVHGSYLNALAALDHDWYVPTKPGAPEGYLGQGWTFPDHARLATLTPAERLTSLASSPRGLGDAEANRRRSDPRTATQNASGSGAPWRAAASRCVSPVGGTP